MIRMFLVIVFGALLAACETTSAVVEPAKVDTSVYFIEPAIDQNSLKVILGDARFKNAQIIDDNNSLEVVLRNACFVEKAGIQKQAGALVSVVPDFFAAVVVDQIEKAIAKEIANLSTTYGTKVIKNDLYFSVQRSTQPRFGTKVSGSTNKYYLTHPCFLLERRKKGADKDSAPDFQLVVQSQIVDDSLRLRPMRLYMKKTAAKSDNADSWGIGINTKISSFWRHDNEGKSKLLYDGKLAKKKIVPEKLNKPIYLFEEEGMKIDPILENDSKAVILPFPTLPASGPAPVLMEFTIAEVGKNKSLERLKYIFGKLKDPVESQIKTALESFIEEEEEEDTDTADGDDATPNSE